MSTPSPDARSTGLRAGVGKVDITCREEGVWEDLLSDQVKPHIPPDYLRRRIEISDPLFVRALVLDDGRTSIVLVTMDVTAIGARSISQNILDDSADDFLPRLRRRIEEELGIPGNNVNVMASHTHQVPRMLCDDNAQLDRTLEAIRQARAQMVDVTVGVGAGRETGLTCNRTMRLKDGSDCTVRSYHAPMPPDDTVEGLRPIDPEIGVLRVDRLDGHPLALVYNFATHLSLGASDGTRGTITADHVGVTLRYLEENIGDGVATFFLQGGLGDVQEACVFDTQHPPTAEAFGTHLGRSVLAAYRDIDTGPSVLGIATRTVALPLRTDLPPKIEAMRQEQARLLASLRYTSLDFKSFLPLYLKSTLHPDHPSHWAYRYLHAADTGDTSLEAMDERNRTAVSKYLDSIRTMERMADNEENLATIVKHQEIIESLGSTTVSAEFQGIRIGDAVFITAPMEVLSETSLALKQQSPFERTFVVSLANGYLHYAPPPSYYSRDGYEATECLLAPAWEEVFDGVVRELYAALGGQSR